MPRKTHLIVDSGCTQDNERWSLSACGLNEDSDGEWDGARDRESVTCKRCQAHMAKPRKYTRMKLGMTLEVIATSPPPLPEPTWTPDFSRVN